MIVLTKPLLARFQEKCNIPSVSLQGMIKSADGDAIKFAQFIMQEGYLDRDTAGDLLAEQFQCSYINLSKSLFQQDIVDRLPAEMAARYQAIPLFKFGAAVTVGMA